MFKQSLERHSDMGLMFSTINDDGHQICLTISMAEKFNEESRLRMLIYETSPYSTHFAAYAKGTVSASSTTVSQLIEV